MADTPKVKVGQVWRDEDPRQSGRTVEIMSVDHANGRAQVRLNTVSYNVSRNAIGRRTMIRLDRFGTDYVLSDVEPHRFGTHKVSGNVDYWPVSQIGPSPTAAANGTELPHKVV